MRAITYAEAGGPEVLHLVDRPIPEPGEGRVRVRMVLSGVNPTDWKSRSTATPAGPQTPHQDGAGVVDAVGPGVDPALVGRRVWLWMAAFENPHGTAAEFAEVPVERAVPMADDVPFEVGAALGVPFLTAHRCLTVAEGGPAELEPGSLAGVAVLVQGGAGAVGNAAIQLARWAGATVITTVSSAAKAAAARSAGAQHIVVYTRDDVVAAVRAVAPDGVRTVVEVDVARNAATVAQLLALHGAVAIYAGGGGAETTVEVRPQMQLNSRWQYVLLYSQPRAATSAAVRSVSAALAAGAIRVGPEAGLPLHRYALTETAAAQQAVQDGAVGKVLVEVTR